MGSPDSSGGPVPLLGLLAAACALLGAAFPAAADDASDLARVREIEAAMDGAQRVTGGPFDLYLAADRRWLVYRKQPCAPGDAGGRFFLHVIPADPDDLPPGHRAHGFYNLGFWFMDYGLRWQGACLAAVLLPNYPIDHLSTSQDGQSWQELRAAPGALLLAGLPAAEEEDAGGHPTDPWFALDHVLDVAVEMAPADWDRLRRQARTSREIFGGECLAQPFPSVFSWFAADVTVNGQRYGNVGVRKKGFLDSLSEEKPALKLAFDKFVDGQALGGVLRRITLNNGVQDPAALLNTCLAYSVFADAGLPAPRCNYAAVTVNGEYLGLYAHVEDVERSLLERAFADAGGNLYEGTISDFHPEFRGTIEKKTNRDADDWSDVDAVVAALQDPSPAGLEALAAVVDLDRFLTFWAAEVLVGHWNGYAGSRRNFHFYAEPGGRIEFIPWDTSNTFHDGEPRVMVRGAIAHRLYGDAAWRAAFLQRLRELLDTVWNETELLRRSERMAATVQAHALPNRVRRFIAERRGHLLEIAAAPPPRPPVEFSRSVCFGTPTTDAGGAGGHPADPWFSLERVLDVAVEMAPADWDRLRRQALNWEAEGLVGADCLGQPFPSVFSWFAADVTVNGQRYGNVGVRKKGFRGSSSEEKPSLKLAFDRFVDGQALGGALRRITLNNSVQDPSLLSTCLAYRVFADAGLPAPRCNYAAVTVNGEELGLYVHVEDIERSLLERAFADAGGNLYEGTYSDFRPEFRGTFEKKTNEDADDWTDVDAVVAALEDPSPAGLEALAAAVDLDRFLTFWAAEVLVRHRSGYAGNRKNFWVYREPDGRFVFIPWDTDSTFLLDAAEVIALGAIAHRLYGDAAWRAAFLQRLRELLDTVWNETELLRRLERMAAIVRAHALPGEQANAAHRANRVRGFIDGRRGRLLEMAAAPPPRPAVRIPKCAGTAFELRFKTTWGSRDRADPFTAGTVTVNLNGADQAVGPAGATAGWAGPQDEALPGLDTVRGVITVMTTAPDSSIHGVTYWAPPRRFVDDAHWSVLGDRAAGWKGLGRSAIKWSLPPGATGPEQVFPIFVAKIDLDEAGTEPGAAVSGLLHGRTFGPILGIAEPKIDEEPGAGLIINEVAARGQPRDWFELYNAGDAPLALAGFVFADDLTDRGRRTPFPAGLSIAPGAYLRIELDSAGWPGFALGRDEELGIWHANGRLVAQVDWQDGDSGRGLSYARVPDVTGPFRTVATPTPGAPNARPGGE